MNENKPTLAAVTAERDRLREAVVDLSYNLSVFRSAQTYQAKQKTPDDWVILASALGLNVTRDFVRDIQADALASFGCNTHPR